MKKNLLIFGLIAATAVVFSCSKEPVQVEPAVTPAEETEEPTPDTPAVDGNLLTSFGVTFEGDTKVTVDLSDGETEIEVNDKVLVFVNTDNNAIYKYDGSKFVLEDGETAVSLDAPASVFYPAAKFEKTTGKFIMPHGIEATGNFGAINPMAGQITGTAGSYSVVLGNIASILRVNVTAGVNINSVTLDYGSLVYYAAGSKFNVNADTKEMTYSDASDYTYETVELGTHALTADVLFIIPTVGLANGLTVTANLDNYHNGGVNTFTVENTSTTARLRNKISTMNFYAGLFSGGTGVDGDPYLIANARDFKNLQKYTVSGYRDADGFRADDFLAAHYQQIANINAGSVTPIGTTSAPFRGVYDGKYEEVINSLTVSISSEGNSTGVFGQINGATIQNMIVEGSVTSTGENTGGIVGRIQSGQIINCTNNAIVQGVTAVGGIAGRFDNLNTISASGCINTGSIEGSGIRVGGIVGFMGNGIVESCCNKGNVKSNDENSYSSIAATGAGGIAGDMRGGTVNLCYSSDDATITSFVQAGGIVGVMYSSNGKCLLINCAAKSEVQSTQTSSTGGRGHAGGLVGTMTVTSAGNDITVANSVAFDAKIYGGFSDANVGGIVGRIICVSGNESKAIVRNCYYQGNSSKIGYSTNDGNTISASTNTGGVFGYAGSGDSSVGAIYDSYCHTSISKIGVGGKVKTNVQKLADNVINGNTTAEFGAYFSGKAKEITDMLTAMRRGSWSTSTGYSNGFEYTSSASSVHAKYWDWKDSNAHPAPRDINYGN